MSSSYHVLCLSHDPAIVAVSECRGVEGAERLIAAGIEGHEYCDLVIMRVSGGPIEFGCPPVTDRVGQRSCGYHRHSTEWADVAWLRVLHIAYGTDPDRVQECGAILRCWPSERVHRLRYHLGIVEQEAAHG